FKVILSSNAFDVPVDVNPDTISTYRTAGPFCVNAGDYITFNDEGGWDPNFYPSGTPFEVFTSAPATTTAFYTKDNGTNIGQMLPPATRGRRAGPGPSTKGRSSCSRACSRRGTTPRQSAAGSRAETSAASSSRP